MESWGGGGCCWPAIEPPRYDGHAEFGPGVAAALTSWLGRHVSGMEASVIPSAAALPTGTVALPLASGDQLVIQSQRTVDDRFHELLAPIARYVAAQNSLFSAERDTREDGMILASPAIREVHRRVVEAAMQRVRRIVLLGPSGTGKERLARAYHRHIERDGPFVTVNCATLTADRLVADLFGAEVGAYTGAQKAVIGAVERADHGTLFLDEIGEMPLDVQSQLLRFLDTGEYQRLGSVGLSRTANVHVVAATNRDLRFMVGAGGFRLDLFFRIALEVIDVPSLRERTPDLTAYLAGQMLGSTSALDALAPDAVELLRGHPWPGNFRELINFAQRLPRPSLPRSISVEVVRRALQGGALFAPVAAANAPTLTGPAEPNPDSWRGWLEACAAHYCADHGADGPTTWGEMATFIEQYLKPYALVHMAGVAGAADADAVSVPKVADRIKADRGTVSKQLRRYFTIRR